MRLIPSEYMAWAKRVNLAPLPYELTQSGMPSLRWESLPVAEATLHRPYPYDCPELLEVLAAHHRVRPDQVVIAGGTSMANFLVGVALLSRGDRVLIESPYYEPLHRALESMEVEMVPWPRPFALGFQPDLEGLERRLEGVRLVVLTNLHNPTGVVLEKDRLERIVAAAGRAGAMVLIDEIYLDFCADPPCAPIGDNVVTTASLTKVYGLSGLRMGWIVGPAPVIARVRQAKDVIQVIDPFPMQDLAARVLADRDRFRDPHRAVADANRPVVTAFARSRNLPWIEPPAGIIGMLGLPPGLGAPGLVNHLISRYQTRAVPGDFFGLPGFLRVGYGQRPEVLAEGLRRLGQALDDLAPK